MRQDGIVRPYEFSADDLEKIRGTILNDFEKMNASYEIGNYPASPEPRKCMSCQFGRVCPESRVGEYLDMNYKGEKSN